MGAGRSGSAGVRRGRGQEGAGAVARVPGVERRWLGQGLAARNGWARAMGMAGIGLVMVGSVMVMVMRWLPSIGAAGPNGHRATGPLRGAARQAGSGGDGPGAIPGCSGMAPALLKRRWEIGAGRGSGTRALMLILG